MGTAEDNSCGTNNTGVLISIRPKWVEKIINGNKTMEVRKMKPRMKPPFTVYCYCTVTGEEKWLAGIKGKYESVKLNGHVCMEFTCDRIDEIVIRHGQGMVFKNGDEYIRFENVNEMCLTKPELYEYMGRRCSLYAWHISDLKVYAHPIDLEMFNYEGSTEWVRRAPQGIAYVDNPHRRCVNCDHREGNKCLKNVHYLPYDAIFTNSCGAWTLSRKGCYATCKDEYPELRR